MSHYSSYCNLRYPGFLLPILFRNGNIPNENADPQSIFTVSLICLVWCHVSRSWCFLYKVVSEVVGFNCTPLFTVLPLHSYFYSFLSFPYFGVLAHVLGSAAIGLKGWEERKHLEGSWWRISRFYGSHLGHIWDVLCYLLDGIWQFWPRFVLMYF